jgi:hypothetical protein
MGWRNILGWLSFAASLVFAGTSVYLRWQFERRERQRKWNDKLHRRRLLQQLDILGEERREQQRRELYRGLGQRLKR